MKQLLTVTDVASMLRVSRTTIYSWAAAAKIPHLRVNGRLRFAPEILQQWLLRETARDASGKDHDASNEVSRKVVRRRVGRHTRRGKATHEAPLARPDEKGRAGVRGPAHRGRLIDLDALRGKEI